jgi:hypothetical protein
MQRTTSRLAITPSVQPGYDDDSGSLEIISLKKGGERIGVESFQGRTREDSRNPTMKTRASKGRGRQLERGIAGRGTVARPFDMSAL